jgi:hypothetical protein
MSTPDLDALRQAVTSDTLPVEMRTQIADLIAVFQQQQDALAGPHEHWYHVSPHALPPGTVLTPAAHRDAPATSQDFYDTTPGIIDLMYPLDGSDTARTDVVWVTPDLADAGFWSRFLRATHVYEVQPQDTPQPWNGTGIDGWVVTAAVVITEIKLRENQL